MIDLINNYKTISIIGMAKNVGKTTTLNYLLSQFYNKKVVGLTSIGRDGEEIDVVTNTPKPKIYIEKGTIIATTINCLNRSDFTKQILETTSMTTSLGDVVIVKALSDGFVDLAGPSFNAHIKTVIDIFKKYKVDISLIDGAINRKGIASQFVSDATILATGAAYSNRMEKVVSDTKNYIDVLTQKATTDDFIIQHYDEFSNICIIDESYHVQPILIKTALNSKDDIVNHIDEQTKYLIIKGALSEELLKRLIESRHRFNRLTIIVENGTKCIYDYSVMEKLNKCGVFIEVIYPTKVLCLTYNPTSPHGYEFDDEDFHNLLKHEIQLPIYNVMRDKL